MATKRCCCAASCEIGEDNFNRVDAPTPGPKWLVMSGSAAIVDNHIELAGSTSKVATTICHPTAYVWGSTVATFTLVNVRSISLFEVGVGSPISSPWRIQFIPLDMDLITARIKVRTIGDVTTESEVPWPVDGFADSSNTVSAQVCYEPGALLRGGIGVIPQADACIDLQGWEDNCYTTGSDTVGNFFFTEGHFDNFAFTTTILDNYDCPVCGCFCFKREGATKTWNCYPETLCLTLTVKTGSCLGGVGGITIILYQGTASPTFYPEKIRWFSEIQTCINGALYSFVAECSTIVKDGTNWFQSLSLRMADGSYTYSTVVFNWVDPGVTTAKTAVYGLSTCEPLYMVYPDLLLNSFFGPCGAPGEFGHIPFCCDTVVCYPIAPIITLEAVITECP